MIFYLSTELTLNAKAWGMIDETGTSALVQLAVWRYREKERCFSSDWSNNTRGWNEEEDEEKKSDAGVFILYLI